MKLVEFFNANVTTFSNVGVGDCYLAHDKRTGWSIQQLNCIQRLFRFLFGAYNSTHLKNVMAQLRIEVAQNSADPKYNQAFNAMIPMLNKIWVRTYGSAGAIPITTGAIPLSGPALAVHTVAMRNLCENCLENPKYVENGHQHDYCRRTCAKIAMKNLAAENDFDPAQPQLFFYNRNNKNKPDEAMYYPFTNFAEFPLEPTRFNPGVSQNLEFTCTEIAFQMCKFMPNSAGWKAIDAIREKALKGLIKSNEPSSARQAFQTARDSKFQTDIRPDWHLGRKDKVMYEIVVSKFTQNKSLRQLLTSTGKREIVEHTANDNYWADGAEGPQKGTGVNKLGKILMRVRSEMAQGII